MKNINPIPINLGELPNGRRPNVEGIGLGHVLKAFGFIDEIQRDLPFDLGIHVAGARATAPNSRLSIIEV